MPRWLKHPLVQLALLLAVVSLALQGWQGHREADLGARIAAAAAPGELRMISSEDCGICSVARRWFAEHEVAVAECFVERDAACRAEFEALGARGTPVLLVRGRPQLGFSPPLIAQALGLPG
jgi:glutaredoxin